ncbi:Ig domain protein group 1 domain protein [Rahnella sikkimica]|nr:Ig domain protein group 1 domain protein [Rahnella sikkimica]
MKKLIAWLKNLFIKETIMSEPLVDAAVDLQPVFENVAADVQPAAPVAVVTSPLDAEKSAFANFVAFVEHGVEKLGSEAEAELVALAKKYL